MLANLSPAKRLLLEKRLRGEKITSSIPALVRIPRNGSGFALSYAQQRLWFIDQLTPGRAAYNNPGGMRLAGTLNLDALRNSLKEIVRRHEALRTRFIAVKGEPQQVVDETTSLDIPIVELTGTPVNEREAEARRWARAEAAKPFNLEHGPVFRASLLRLSDQDHILLLNMHHIISDGWSAEVLLREFAAVYAALSTGRPSPLPELPVQYADYSVWQRSWLKGAVLEDKLSYWKQHLVGFETAEIATDFPRPTVQGQSGSTLEVRFDNKVTDGVRELSRGQGATLYMVLLGALQLLIYRYSGQRDVLIGSPVAGRTQSQVEGLIGLFVNTLVLRTIFHEGLTFAELLGQVKKGTLEAFGHQDVPFEKIVDGLQLERDLSRSPLFQVAFALQGAPPEFEVGAVKVKPYIVDNGTSKFDLTFLINESNTSIQCWLEYNNELFTEATARGILHHLNIILTYATLNPGARIDAIPLLSETEKRELLQSPGIDLPAPMREQTICSLIASYGEQRPQARALVSHGIKLTYQELNQRTSKLALRIRGLGLEPAARIGICLEQGPTQVIAALAVLKAGAVFVPLDVEEAPERLSYILADSGISAIIADAKGNERIPARPELHRLLPDDASEKPDHLQVEKSEQESQMHSVACVLYRSGPSGRPEGVLVPQRALLGSVFDSHVNYSGQDRIAQSIRLTHDVAGLHVFAALACGSCVVDLSRKPPLSPREMAKLLRDESVTVILASAAELEGMVRYAPNALRKLRLVLFDDQRGLTRALPESFQNTGPEQQLAVYASTESGSWPLLYPLNQNGSPLHYLSQGSRIYILDSELEPSPYGTVGEIFIASEGLARGYHQNPKRTAESFIPNLFSQVSGARLYRTGDLARRRHDGHIQFLGRRDGRMVISGFQVHVKEIERVVRQHEAVQDAAVLVQATEALREPSIALFVVAAETRTVGREELRYFLEQHLPGVMLPASITVTQAIPRTITGNPDFRVLAQMLVERKFVAPRNPIEEVLCGIWSKLLNREQVGIHDNFFEMGGDSILSVQVISEAREAGLQITPQQLFAQQTIAELAEVATVLPSVGTEVDAAEISMTGPVLMTPVQKLFFEWDLERPEHFNQSVLLRLKSAINSEFLEKAWIALLQHHDALRMRFEIGEGGWKQFCAERIPAGTYLQRDISRLGEAEQRAALEQDAQQVQASLDLEAGRLVTAVEYNLGVKNGLRLLLVIHHLVVDGISWRILLEDLERGYEQLQQGKAVSLGAKTSSYKKWTEGIHEYGKDELLRQEGTYWTQQRHGKPLPRDFENSPAENTAETSRTVEVQLEAQETRELLQSVPSVYRTQINDVLLTALGRVCSEWSGEPQVLVDLEGHGREELISGADVSRTVGWFATIYPVTMTAEKRWDPGRALKATKEHLRGVPNHGFGYGVLRYISGEKELQCELAAIPNPEILFNYLGQVDQLMQASRLFLPATEGVGKGSALQNQRPYVLGITGIVSDGKLQITWEYSEKLHRRETIERLAQAYIVCLQEIIEHCRDPKAAGFTPSDFPLARLRQEDLDTWIGSGEGIEDIYGLSPMQQGMLFHSIFESGSGSGVYFVQIGSELYGALEVGKFRSAWEEVVQRHKILRTEFLWEGLEEPVQIVRTNVDITWREEDWRGLSGEEQKQRWESFLRHDRQQGFDIRRAPLLHFALFRTGDESYYFDWSSHHILMDGWCLSILLSEAITGYMAKCKGQALRLERPHPYREYIRWLRQQDERATETFWREELKGFGAATRLRLEEALAPVPPGEEPYEEANVPVAQELTQKLEHLARNSRVTLNTVIQGAWAFLLSRYSGETDVVFGAIVAGRSAPVKGIESIVGLFINTLPARVQLQPADTLGGYFKELQKKQVEVRNFEHSPLIKVQEWSEIQRGKALFESIVVFENFPIDPRFGESMGSSLKLGKLDFFERTNYPFSLRVVPGKELAVTLIYDRRLFAKQSVERLLGHLHTVLSAMSAGPEIRVGELSLLQETERQQVLLEWNQTARAYPEDKCIHELVAQRAARVPGATALEYQGQQVTYEQLDQRSNQFAHFLRRRGTGPETIVAVYLERSAELVTALLGILKAGGAYVPLDLAYPAERLKYMMEDSKAAVVLTRSTLLPSLPAFSGAVVKLDEHQAEIDGQTVDALPPLAVPENLAYVFYTSGSTGTPKGIAGTHRGMVNRMAWMANVYPIREDDVCCQKTSFGFADSIAEMFAPLLGGAPLKIVPEETAKDAGELVGFLRAENVTRIVLVPSLLRAMLGPDLAATDALNKMRIVVTSGEALPVDLANLAKNSIPGATLLNFYGSTEMAADATWCDLTSRQASTPVLIGKPIANMRAYVVDDDMQPAAIGITGNLYIGGPGLARGYMNRGDLTAERFVPDPFSKTGGERLYQTGDLARWRAGGNLEFVGRKDHQVKVRGQRIELAEIEAALSADPAVAQAIMIAQSENGETRLIAYVVAKGKTTAAALRNSLRQRLPEYMLPAAFVMLEALPLNASGKVDRRALPAPVFGREGEDSGYVAPRTQVEELLAQIWTEVLRVEKIGVNDNFFNLGGQSLLATQVIARVSKVFGVPLQLRHLFATPTIAGLASQVEPLIKDEKKDATPALVRVMDSLVVPLSYAQQRLWFIEQLTPGNTVYNIAAPVRILGPLDLPALQHTLNEIIRRHESLRTHFGSAQGEPHQIIDPPARLQVQPVDLTSMPEREREAEATKIALEEIQTPFDLGLGPLFRVKLLRLAEDNHVLVATMHHIISDGWSNEVLMRELSVLYEAFTSGQSSPLPELAIQYADYAAWERKWLSGENLEKQIRYWQEQLEGVETLDLPTDRPRPSFVTYNGASESVAMGPDLTESLRKLGRSQGTTLYMTLLAAWQVLLWRYSGQEDIAVGSPVAGRKQAELEGLIGFFVNALVLRSQVRGSLTFAEFLRQVRETTLQAYAHQDVPFEKLVEVLHPERDMSRTPLFQVMFMLQNAPQLELEFGASRLVLFPLLGNTAKFDLTLSFYEVGGGLRGGLNYNTDFFAAPSMARMAGHWLTLLHSLTAEPERPLNELTLLSGDERRQVLEEWNHAALKYPQKCVHELFAEQAERTPQAVALQYAGQKMSYAELDQRANQLGHYLRKLGVAPEVRVGICVERSLEMVVGLMGILKAGGAYVPLDMSYPSERLTYILQDAQVSVVVTLERFVERLSGYEGTIVRLDSAKEEIRQQSLGAPTSGVGIENLMYVIYTSGSTGEPKGSEVAHRSIPGFIFGIEYAHFDEGTVFLQHSSVNWDALTLELWPALLKGGCCVLAQQTVLEPEELRGYVQDGVNTLWLTATLFSSLVETDPGCLKGVREIMTGGESVPVKPVRQVLEQLPGTQVVNGYGPSECTVFTNCYVVPRNSGGNTGALPIGKPIGDRRVYVLDAWMEPVPIGIGGEIYIGGPSIARGYLKRPELTAERFVPNSFSQHPGDRLYRTGDRARWRADGNLEFLGRVDRQVKLRGFRIELGEIEAALREQAGVAQAAVLVREQQGDKRLVAYVVTDESKKMEGVREELRKRLPEQMVPSGWVKLDRLPLTSTGKLDWRALPEPGWESGKQYVAPRNEREERLAEIWAQVLRVDRVGVEDNFFDLGGHSLLATQVMSRIRNVLQVEIPLRQLFEAPTIAQLAKALERFTETHGKSKDEPVRGAPSVGAVPLSYAQQRLWFVEQLAPGAAYNIPAAVRIRGPFNVATLERSLAEVIRRHASLRTRFAIVEGEARQVIDQQVKIEMPIVELEGFPEEEQEAKVKALAIEEGRGIFDLSQVPLLRVKLLRLAEQHHVLLMTMHHIISDGWSMGILVQEISVIYAALQESRPSPLPDLPIQYADYSVWQRRWLQGEVLEKKLNYWRKQLTGMEPFEVPADHPRPAVQTPNGANFEFLLSVEMTDQIKGIARREGVTLYMFLLAALQTLLYRYTRQTDVVVGSSIAGRTQKETEGLIGFFVNMLVMRGNLAGNPGFTELLQRVKELTLEAYAHQEAPFERLVEEFEPGRELSRTPLFQVAFVLLNAPQTALGLGGTKLEPFSIDNGTAKYDLTLSMGEGDTGIVGVLQYNTDLFERTTVAGMAQRFSLLFKAILENPEQSIGALPLITAEERHNLQMEWRGAPYSIPEETICTRIQAYAERNSQALAVLEEDVSLGYGDLNRQANQLAHALQKIGVQSGQRVGICLDKGVDWVAGTIGILKAGAVFVPLEPTEPELRFTHILQNASLRAVVTEEKFKERFQPSQIETICYESFDKENGENPNIEIATDAVACILYRSGTSGTPEGILLNHRVLCAEGNAFAEITATDRVAQRIDFSREAGCLEVFHTLSAGGCVVSIPRTPLPSRQLAALIRDHAATMLWTTGPLLERMASGFPRALKDLRLIFCEDPISDLVQLAGGLKPEIKSRIYGTQTDTEMVGQGVLYQVQEVEAFNAIRMDRLPRGTTIHLLDQNLAPAPAGLLGEIYIGSELLAAGYDHDPARSTDVFLPDSPTETSRQRLYKTGELGRRRNDGRLELRGRCDRRVVIGGLRVELSEIEAALMRHPGIKQAAVVAQAAEKLQGQGLVAYLVVSEGQQITIEEMRQFLSGHLPEPMIPANILIVDAIPRTASGRIDQRRLNEKLQHEEYAAPKNKMEEILCGIWAKLLQVEKVGIHDNFFRLGGDSILSVQVITLARQAGIQITPRQMFERQTIADLAKVATVLQEAETGVEESGTGQQAESDGVTQSDFSLSGLDQEELDHLISGNRDVEDIYSLTPMQEGMLFHSVHEADGAVYFTHMSCRMQGKIDYPCFRQAWEDVIERHAILRTSFRWENLKTPVQVVHKHAPLPWREEDWRGLGEQEQQQKWQEFLQQDREQGLDFLHAPLMRLGLFRTGEESQYFVWGFGHILMDGWCVAIVMSEVFKFYEARRAGKKLELETPPLFRNYIAWLRQQEEKKAEAFWRSELKGFKAATKLRIEHEPRQGTNGQGANGHGEHRQIRFPLERATTAKLEELARAHEVTLNAVVQGAWGILLSRYSGDHDVVFGATIAGRSANVRGIERMVGLFINTLPVRVGVPDHETVAQYLKRLQQRQAEARDVEYAPLVKVQNWSEVPPGSPLFESLMVFENLPVDTVLQQQLAQQLTFDSVQLINLSNYPLALRITPANKELIFDLIYKTQIYDDKSAERMVDHLKAVLEQMGTRPDGEVGQISLLMQDEYRQLVDDWNQEESDFYEQ